MVHAVNSGHPGGSLGCAEFLVVLYQNIMDRKEGFEMDGIEKIFSSFKRSYLLYCTVFQQEAVIFQLLKLLSV
jgi:transketolase